MSAFDETRALIQGLFKNGFVDDEDPPGAFFPTQYENHAFTKPEGATWARFSIREGERENATVGNDLKRTPGVVFVQIFIPEGKGTTDGNRAAAKIATIFDDRTESGAWGSIQFFSTAKQNIGKGADGLFQVNITIPFRVDENN